METDKSLIESVLSNLRKRRFGAYYCETADEARDLALSLIPSGDTVAWGGSRTAEQIGLIDAVKRRGDIKVIDRDKALSSADRRRLMREGLLADTFIAGINAISRDGWLVNIDGTGNRVAAITFGPENVILVAGVNKIADGAMQSAIARARNIAAPLNTARLDLPTPCKETGRCADCMTDNTICCHFSEIRYCKPAERIKIVLIGEELGF